MLRKLFAFAFLLLFAASCETDTTDYGPIDKKIIEDYLTAKNLTAQSTSSGLYYIIEKQGSANHPNINSTIQAKYKGYLVDGTVFDSQLVLPATFKISSVIAGWQEGIKLIGASGKIKLLIPSALGYGSTAKTGIPANSVLIFDVEIIDFY
jgi:FKBP-type peptidyl-prolyl cis-trans isomerase FkpA